ncbi:hypothetical protein FZI91_22525 [Mycobacterium sp. CBMA271]|uniref:hypothetical protein n=1 Tax=unclassified Mycobacteroides TaxID=2618759 RepID=UPI0012DD74C3|nr:MULTISPECIES: hypothetical protein [unclassified Mycobacteroides]MUM24459.1 hypothetical protein [Mycobacteroides sp. CBMA 271]
MRLTDARRTLFVLAVGIFAAAPAAFAVFHPAPAESTPLSIGNIKCSVHTSTTVCGGDHDAELHSKPNLKDIPAKPTKPAKKTGPTVVEPAG